MRKKGFGISESQLLSRINEQKAGKNGIVIDANLAEQIRITDNAPEAIVPSESVAPQSALSAEAIKAMIEAALTPLQAKTAELETAKEAAENLAKEAAALATAKDLEAKEALEKLNQTEAELTEKSEALTTLESNLAQTQQQLETVQKDAKTLEDLGKLMGGTALKLGEAAPLTVQGDGSAEMRGFEKLTQGIKKTTVVHEGKRFLHCDSRAADQYFRQNKQKIVDGVEAVMREAGYLQGANVITEAPAVVADIPSVAFNVLSTYVRESRYPDLIYHQFANTAAAPGTAPNLNTAVPRYPYRARPASLAERTLTPGTDLNTARQNVTQKNALITILELGLGNNTGNASPIALTNFLTAFSMVDLMAIVERDLGRDYQATKDLALYSQWFTATRIVYNNGNTVTTDPTTVVAGKNGTITRAYLRKLSAYMKTAQVATFSNGLYGLVLTPDRVADLIGEITVLQRFNEPTSNEIEMVSKILGSAAQQEFNGEVSGYVMTLDGFMIFTQNSHSIAASPGTDPGVQTVTFGTGIGAQTCETQFAFGRNTMAWATALPMEIRRDDMTDFGRRNSYIWYSHENAGELDINENSGTGYELRVIAVRSLRTPV